MYKKSIAIGAILAAISVALGAFGAHGLKSILNEDSLKIFETAVRYQFYHSLALLFIGCADKYISSTQIRLLIILFSTGIILFSGSLYAIIFLKVFGITANYLGIVTPFGGLSFITAWLMVVYISIKK